MCLHQDQNCPGINCPCDCMNCMFASDRDESLLRPPAHTGHTLHECLVRSIEDLLQPVGWEP
jgi:hypothetical protein